jgi:hypothetical protein|tara:strand:- start:1144 stop:1323 length:180 start_codon:yes stop_codon:yes gene_type:complete
MLLKYWRMPFLNKKDSLHYFLKNVDISIISASFPNSRPEMNLHRKTPEFIAFLEKKNFL